MTLDGQEILRHHWAAWTGGNYQICVLNKSQKDYQFTMTVTTGIEAIDYSTIVTKKHLQPVDLAAQKVQDQIEQIRTDLSSLLINEELMQSENELIKSRVVSFGLISLGVMCITTFLQIKYLKSFFRHKKII